jgi:hypothetical protein
MWKPLVIGLALAALFSARTVAQEPVDLERALVRQGPEVIKKLKEKGYKNVGVLKFLAAKEGSGQPKVSARSIRCWPSGWGWL